MAEPFKDPLGYKTKKITLMVMILVVLAAVIIGAGIGINLAKYRRTGGLPAAVSFPAQVAISYPQHGMQLEVGQPYLVEAEAVGPNPFASLELWLDGIFVGVQEAPEGGKQAFETQFSWLPLELGAHSLVAVGVDKGGQKVFSSQVVVIVSQGDFGIDLASLDQMDSLTVLPAPPKGGLNQPDEPEDEASVGQAENWSGTLGNWFNSLRDNDHPAAPELVVRTNDCAANLLIHDLSDNEEGFAVYRQMENSPGWTLVAKLSSQSKAEWITYSDEGIPGLVTYYVTAFNNQGEVKSNLALVDVDLGDCPVEGESQFVEYVEATLVLTAGSAEKVYCYQSRDGVHWDRWPMAGFLTPDQAGYLPTGPIAYQRQDHLRTNPELAYPGLIMECWGWQGGNLSKIGEISVGKLKPEAFGQQLIDGRGMNAVVEFTLKEVSLLPGLFPSQMNTMDEDLSNLPSDVPISPEIPKPTLSATTDRNLCGAHLPSTIQSLEEQLQYCFLFPEYDPDYGGIPPQPYLVWGFDPEPVCVGDKEVECKTYGELLDLAENNGGQVGFTILAIRGENKTVWNLTEPDLTTFVVPPFTCIGDTAFSVRLWYRPGKEGVEVSAIPDSGVSEIGESNLSIPKTYYGPYSNWVTIPCNSLNTPTPVITEMVQYLDFTFDYLNLSVLDDGDNLNLGTQVVELYGYFYVNAPSMGYWVEEPCIFNGLDACKDDLYDYMKIGKIRYLLINEWGGTGSDFINGLYPLEYETLCQSTKRLDCLYEGQPTHYLRDNNTIRVYLKEWEPIFFGVNLVDYDKASDDDKVCVATLYFYSDDPEGLYYLDSKTGSGKCRVTLRIEKVGDPVPIVLPDKPD